MSLFFLVCSESCDRNWCGVKLYSGIRAWKLLTIVLIEEIPLDSDQYEEEPDSRLKKNKRSWVQVCVCSRYEQHEGGN